MANAQNYMVSRLFGRALTLAAAAARTASGNGDAVFIGDARRLAFLLSIAASATDAGDTCDVFVDLSFDGTTWVNALHFTQQAGNGAAVKQFAVLDASNPGTSVVAVTSDAAAGAVRPALFGAYARARWAIADAGTDNASHTFSVTAYAQ